MSRTRLVLGCLLACALGERAAMAGQDAAAPPEIRAVRLAAPLKVDGVLDESLYAENPPFSNFIQTEPISNAPATEKTDVWVGFDRAHVYICFRVWESRPERMIVNEMRRDNNGILQNEHVAIMLDTFHDRRNSYQFMVTPLGARIDGQTTNERTYNGDLNPIWDVGIGRFDGGWTAEMAIPFKSLRYAPGRDQTWGFLARRVSRWKNEIAYSNQVPNGIGQSGIMRASSAGTLVGLDTPSGSHNLDVKPFVTAQASATRVPAAPLRTDRDAQFGVDAKYAVTQNLAADVTYNTDFAQVEADEQQVNLTRFSLFFPEKREFFLENQGVFAFGGAGGATGSAAGDAPILFYSRRIGLNGSSMVPIQGGGRLTGRAGRFTLGAMDIRTDNSAGVKATNFSIVRVKRDILRRSSVGALLSDRSISQFGAGRNQTYGVDGSFAFLANLSMDLSWARTDSARRRNNDADSYRTQLDYAGDRYAVQADHLAVGADFNPEIGFVRRVDIHKNHGLLRFSPRTKRFPKIRKFTYQATFDEIRNGAGRRELATTGATFAVERQTGDKLTVDYTGTYEYIPAPFRISSLVTLPVGGYDYDSVRAGYFFAEQRRMTGSLSLDYGTFYSGHKLGFTASRGRLKITPRISAEPTYSRNRVTLPQGSFTTNLLGSRITVTPTPQMFLSALLQYNSSTNAMASNIRFRWEYQPGSELFVVYNEQRDTLPRGFPDLTDRAFIVKINRLFRF